MVILPKLIAPKFEYVQMLTRDEIIAKWLPLSFEKEQLQAKHCESMLKKKAAEEIRKKNVELLRKVRFFTNIYPFRLFIILFFMRLLI